jgi:hypothetical protein
MPVALWRTERLVQAPGVRNAGWLALVLTLQLLAGLPQTLFFTYQLIALRIAWALLVRESRPPLTLVLLTAVAGLLPLGLAAVQLVPAMEMAGESLRQLPLDTSSIGPGFSWHRLATMAGALVVFPVDRLLLVFVAFSLPALRHVNDRRHVAFWGLIAVAYLVLSLGPGSLLWVIYEQLPLGSAFRGSQRLIWVVALALSLLVAFGSETIVARLPRALRWLPPLAIFVCAVSFGASPLRSVRGDAAYDTHAEAWSFVRQHLTAVDRVAIVGGELPDFAVMPKSASLFAVPAIYDYEPQMSLRYAEYFSWMRTGHSLRSVRDWYWVHDKLLPRTLRPTLFDLTAARLVLVEAKNDVVEEVFGPSVRLVGEPGGVRVYENTRALPRVRWVPAAVVRPADTTLAELARPEHEPRRVVVLERAPVSAFLGDAASTKATVVDLVSQRAERLSVRLRAPAPGFLVVADQWFPGWRATVNGGVAEILRADYAFRAVEVPAGDVEVVFQYRPFSVLLGAVVSVLSAIGFVVAMRRGS